MRLRGFMVGALALALTVPAGTAAASSGDGATSAKRKKSDGRLFYATDRRGNLLNFREGNTRRFGSTSRRIRGLPSGVVLRGIDFRPKTGDLYGLGSNSVIYRVSTISAIAVAEGPPFSPALRGSSFGFDFNPVPDKIRVTSDANQSLRVNPDGGALTMADGDLNTAGRDPRIVGSAYENSRFTPNKPTVTELYALDSSNDTVYSQTPPNAGTLVDPAKVRFNVRELAGFDIAGRRNDGYVATVGGRARNGARLYRINTEDGRSRDLGRIGDGRTITGLAAVQDG